MARIELSIRNTHFVVKIIDKKLNHLVKTVDGKLTSYKLIYNQRTKSMMKEKDKTWYAHVPHTEEYRYNINMLRDFILLIGGEGVQREEISIKYDKEYTVEPLEANMKEWFKPREHQDGYIKALLDSKTGTNKLVDLLTGKGKASSVDSLIRIPNGWKRMGDIKVNDKIIAVDGTTTRVNAVYPQGKLELYRLTFMDGRQHEACKEHLWRVYNPSFKEGWRIVNTEYLYNKVEILKNARCYIELAESEKNDTKEYILHPYVLGVLIGDGSISTDRIDVIIAEKDILDRFKSLLPKGHFLRKEPNRKYHYSIVVNNYDGKLGRPKNKVFKTNLVRNELRRLKLLGKKSVDKFIPTEYLNGSTDQRYELLKGLMDSDGDVGLGGSLYYNSTSLDLTKDIQTLVRSLQGMARYGINYPSYIDKNNNRIMGYTSYRLVLRMKYPRQCVYTNKKLSRVKEANQYTKTLKLRLDHVEKIGKKEAQCISIDHPSKLYVTGQYVVTHNTFISIHTALKLNMRLMILVLPQFMEKWESDILEQTDITQEEIVSVRGSKQLTHLIENIDDEAKVIIISVRTMMLYIKDYLDIPGNFPVAPENLIEHLKVGTVINDEAHMQTHAVFNAMLYLNPKRFIALSATLDTNQKDLKLMYDLFFPDKHKISNLVKFENYVIVSAVRYKIDNPKGILYKRAQGYNHILFEQSIMKNSVMLRTYLKMIKYYIDIKYKERKEDGEKLLIFFASIRMCSIATNYFKEIYDDLDIRRYVEDDPFENVLEADLCISTNQSAGTAIDIPGLITVIQTVSISSLQQNKQSQGRLREIPGRDVEYCYLYTQDIKNQVKMHHDRTHATKELAKEYRLEQYPGIVKTR